ncbi:MAG: MBL fold metallo-hydrolase [Clostridia bacterium]|nr:MBL fold metallo-hydrolase [Clostridia bacterium]
MEIVKLTLGPYATHTYLVKEDDFCAVIDPEINDGEIIAVLGQRGWALTDILITHAHFDHVRGVNGLPAATLRIHEADAPYLLPRNEELGMPFLKEEAITRPVVPFKNGGKIGPFTVLHMPGHSPGSAVFVAPGHVFSGDSMFVHGVPALDFVLSDRGAYMGSLQAARALDQNARLHAGHGGEGLVRDGIPVWV